jgi:Tetracyclin repressor-like, C-terminal domain
MFIQSLLTLNSPYHEDPSDCNAALELFAQQSFAAEFLEAHNHRPDLERQSLALDTTLQAVAGCLIKDWQDKGAISNLEPTALLTLAHGAFVGLRTAMTAGHPNRNTELIAAAEEQVWKLFER